MDAWQISILIAVLLAIGELLSFSFILLGFSLGMATVALLQALTDGFSPARDVLSFAIASFAAVVICRRVFGRRSDQQKLEQDDINRY
jgi:membrane protein implicated in regulation of membrane protease activity